MSKTQPWTLKKPFKVLWCKKHKAALNYKFNSILRLNNCEGVER